MTGAEEDPRPRSCPSSASDSVLGLGLLRPRTQSSDSVVLNSVDRELIVGRRPVLTSSRCRRPLPTKGTLPLVGCLASAPTSARTGLIRGTDRERGHNDRGTRSGGPRTEVMAGGSCAARAPARAAPVPLLRTCCRWCTRVPGTLPGYLPGYPVLVLILSLDRVETRSRRGPDSTRSRLDSVSTSSRLDLVSSRPRLV